MTEFTQPLRLSKHRAKCAVAMYAGRETLVAFDLSEAAGILDADPSEVAIEIHFYAFPAPRRYVHD